MAKSEHLPEIHGLPHSPDAERAVLGTFFFNPEAVTDVQSVLAAEDFFDPRHQEIFRTIVDLSLAGSAIDLTVVCNELQRRGLLERVGGAAYVAGNEQYVISPGNVLHHAGIVREKSRLRRILQTGLEIAEAARQESDDSESLLRDSEAKLFNILDERSGGGEFRSIADEAHEIQGNLKTRSESRRDTSGVTTGLRDLDSLLGGLQRSDLIILAARPSVGKTSLALNMAVAAARSTVLGSDGATHPAAVGIFSLEMSREQVIQRIVCTEAQMSMADVRKGHLSAAHLNRFNRTLEEMTALPIYINDTSGLTPVDLQLQAQRLKRREPSLSLIVVDYLQLMSVQGKRTESRQQEVSEISRSMKGLARDLHIPVLALSQLSRGIESRKKAEARPRLSDLRESGAIEQDADVVIFIHREDEGRPVEPMGNEPRVRQVSLVVAKQRNGPIDDVRVLFREDFTQFVNMAPGSAGGY